MGFPCSIPYFLQNNSRVSVAFTFPTSGWPMISPARRRRRRTCISIRNEKCANARRRRAGEIHRPSARRKREGYTDAGIICKKYGIEQGKPIITILPGSRRGEIEHHVPVLKEALAEIRQRLPSPPRSWSPWRPDWMAHGWRRNSLPAGTYDSSRKNVQRPGGRRLAIVSSGTATVETALLGKPMIVVYRSLR